MEKKTTAAKPVVKTTAKEASKSTVKETAVKEPVKETAAETKAAAKEAVKEVEKKAAETKVAEKVDNLHGIDSGFGKFISFSLFCRLIFYRNEKIRNHSGWRFGNEIRLDTAKAVRSSRRCACANAHHQGIRRLRPGHQHCCGASL